MIEYSDKEFSSPAVELQGGVAEIDLITLKKVTEEADKRLGSFVLPEVVDFDVPQIFDELCEVKVSSVDPLKLTATIDTKKASWDYEDKAVKKSDFAGYDGKKHYGVRFYTSGVFEVDGVEVARMRMRLEDGRKINMFCADIESVDGVDLYGLWQRARKLTEAYGSSVGKWMDYESFNIPAQQIKYERTMVEIMALNREVLRVDEGGSVEQKAYVALDETGARVKVVTEMREGAMFRSTPSQPVVKTFGEKMPVMFWFTSGEPSELNVPFAVFVTTSEAWVTPRQKVSFDDEHFGD